jgi:arachidonate 15-lipoxygenase
MTRAALNPSLPQNDTPAGQAARAAQLAASRETYQWTSKEPTLPGVPIAVSVPKDNEPTLEWFILLVDVGLSILRNEIAAILSQFGDNAGPPALAAVQAAQVRAGVIDSALAEAKAHVGGHAHSGLIGELIAGAENAIDWAVYEHHVATLHAHHDELGDIIDNIVALLDGAKGTDVDAYRQLFVTFPVPGIAYDFVSNDEFAHLRVAGPNCMLVKAISALPDNLPVDADHYAKVVGGDTLIAALAEGRLFLCDYAELSVLDPGMWRDQPKYVAQPLALFARPPGGSSLTAVAIQCGQDSSEFPIIYPTSAAESRWAWEIAKLVVQVADGNYHELFAHLARTHLVMEAFAIATHRHLAQVHPIWGLLVPHFEGTLFINNAAATSLIAKNGPIDHIFAGTITSSQLAAADDRLAFDFFASLPPVELAARGLLDPAVLPDFPYRDDALLVWQALHDWAEHYVHCYYADDAAVVGDTELLHWAEELAGEGAVKGFGPVTTREQLIDICAMVMFTASAQHAAVNFPQKDIMSFAPAVTGAAWLPVPADASGLNKADWVATMPPLALALDQLNTLVLLGSIHYRRLGDYRSNDFPYLPWFQDPAVAGNGGLLTRFQTELTAVEKRIVERNAARMRPYVYLQPSRIPTSINI